MKGGPRECWCGCGEVLQGRMVCHEVWALVPESAKRDLRFGDKDARYAACRQVGTVAAKVKREREEQAKLREREGAL